MRKNTPLGRPARIQTKLCPHCGATKALSAYSRRPGQDPKAPGFPCKRCTLAAWQKLAATHPAPVGRQRCRVCLELKDAAEFPTAELAAPGCYGRCQACQPPPRAPLPLGEAGTTLEAPDAVLNRSRLLREQRTSLGIAIAHATCPPGHCRTREEIAAFANVGPERIRRLELEALAKLRRRARELLRAAGLDEKGVRL